MTAPDRTGAGLARAAEGALRGASPGSVDLVSAHGTATPFNDAAESKAIAADARRARRASVVVHPFKAQIGHTLGAAGALESLAALRRAAPRRAACRRRSRRRAIRRRRRSLLERAEAGSRRASR